MQVLVAAVLALSGCVLLLVFLVTGDRNSEVDAYATKLLASQVTYALISGIAFARRVTVPVNRGVFARCCGGGETKEGDTGTDDKFEPIVTVVVLTGRWIGGIVEAFLTAGGVFGGGAEWHVVADFFVNAAGTLVAVLGWGGALFVYCCAGRGSKSAQNDGSTSACAVAPLLAL